jgi:hypothetical protein
MRKLIHSKFELDLTPFKISDTEENNWFSDSFFTKYSFPFNIDLTQELDVSFDFISFYNSNPETYYELLYVHNDKIEKAIFEIESHQNQLICTTRFGYEQLPSFDKKLSELSLDKFDLPAGTSIYQHAQTIINQTWPAVNYNFPQIHVDKYDATDLLWNGFGGIINNRVNGAFLTNTVDTVDDITYNRNVMQPLPSLIHILQRGMVDGGYSLAGKILQDPRLQKALVFGDVDYYGKPSFQDAILISQSSSDAVVPSVKNVKYYFNTVLTVAGKYNISGTVLAMRRSNFNAYFFIKYRNTVLWSFYATPTNFFAGSEFRKFDIDINFETIVDLNVNDITIESYQPATVDETIMDLSVICLRLHDAAGVAIPTVSNENKIDLTRAVPDMEFVDFIKVVKNWFNYDLNIVGKTAVMNPIEDEISYQNTEDLQFTEVKYPLRKFTQGTSFLLKFAEIDNKDYKFLPVFHTRETIVNSNFVTNDKTTPIEINALPLPLLTRNGVQTAFALEQNDAKVFLVPYSGMYNGNNLAEPIEEYLLPAVHLQYWKKWFNFRINSHGFTWGFRAWNEQIASLKVKSKIYAYKKFHIIKSINKTEISPQLYEVEIETEGLE